MLLFDTSLVFVCFIVVCRWKKVLKIVTIKSPHTATIPIIIVSAWASTDSRNLGLELGALDYITKPFSPAELVARVNHLLHARAG